MFFVVCCYTGSGTQSAQYVERQNGPVFQQRKDQDAYDGLHDNRLVNKLFGYADAVQGEMEIECEMVTCGHYIGDAVGTDDERRRSAEKSLGDWRLLLQIDSNEECGYDVGRRRADLFWIRKDDLLERNFDKTWFIYQCC